MPVTAAWDSGPGSLREAVGLAQDGDTLDIQAIDTIFLATQIDLSKSLTIQGNGTVLHGSDSTRHFFIHFYQTVSMTDLTFCHGNASWNKPNDYQIGGGAIHNRGTLTLNRCVFHSNFAGFGGAIEVYGLGIQENVNARLLLFSCSFFNNEVAQNTPNIWSQDYESFGGAIYCTGKIGGKFYLYAENTTFSGNEALLMGGAIYAVSDAEEAEMDSLLFSHCTITQNTAPNGGGIEARPGTIGVIQNTILTQNIATDIVPDFRGTLVAQGGNLLGQTASTVNFNLIESGTNFKGVAPGISDLVQISPLAWGHIPLCNSPLLNAATAATPLATDVRGAVRGPLADIGAVERTEADRLVLSPASEGYQTLRSAMSLACSGDTLSLQSLSSDIRLRASLLADKSLTIIGKPNGVFSTLSTTDSVRLLEVEPGVSLVLEDLRMLNGTPVLYGGGAILNKGRLTATRCVLSGNNAQSGGAIACYGAGDTATLTLINCYLSGNTARDLAGGAVDVRAISHPAQMQAIFCTFAENTASLTGSALFADAGSTLELTNSLVLASFGPAVDAPGMTSHGYNALSDTTGISTRLAANDLLLHSPDLQQIAHGQNVFWVPLAGTPPGDGAQPQGNISTDLLGNPRSMGSGPDIGAVEFDLTATAPATAKTLRLWPQPAQESVWIESHTAIQQLTLTAPDGRVVAHQTPGANRTLLPLAGLAAGLYALHLTDATGTVASAMLLIRPN